MISFFCVRCGIRIEVEDSFAGRSGSCPGCKEILQIPPPSRAAAPSLPPRFPGPAPMPGMPSVKGNRRIRWKRWAFPAALLLLLFFFLHPWPQYEWAASRDEVESYEGFAERFPDSHYADKAKQRADALREKQVWSYALESQHVDSFRKYVKEYPDGEHLQEAREVIRGIADRQWEKVAGSKWEDLIRNFLVQYPETSKIQAADLRLQELYSDPKWVEVQDNPEYLRDFIARFPDHPRWKEVKDRLIQVELAAIAAANPGAMPAMAPNKEGGTLVEMRWTNSTGHSLNILYHGPEWGRISIPSNETRSVSFMPGKYQIAATTHSINVRAYHGTDNLKAGSYSVIFHIEDKDD